MKKLLCLFGATLLTLTSCSKDDDNSSTNNNPSAPVLSILPKTISETYPGYPQDNSVMTAVYNGNKIVSFTNEYSRTDFTYDGNTISKMVDYDIVNGKDSKSYEVSYTYANGKLATSSSVENFTTAYPTGQYKYRYVYKYNKDGTVKTESYSTNPTTGIETQYSYTDLSTFVKGNLIKKVRTSGTVGSSGNILSTYEYEYDNKKNPLKNILGFSLLLDNEDAAATNNVLTKTSYTANGTVSNIYGVSYTYDANGYPTKATSYKTDGTVKRITEYTY